MKATKAQRLVWIANAIVRAADLPPESADRDTLLQIAREHLRAIAREKSRVRRAEYSRVSPAGIW
jgi:hypothetical protein